MDRIQLPMLDRVCANKYAVVVMTLLLALCSVLYVMQSNATAAKGYTLSDLETQISGLQRDTQRLEVAIATHQSLTSIHKRMTETSLVPIEHIEYITLSGDSVAQR